MKITIEVEEKEKTMIIPTAFGEIPINAKRIAIVKSDGHPIYSIFYTTNGEFIASVPPSVVKIHDPINFSKIFDEKHYGKLTPHLKKTVLKAMALAAGYEDVENFLDNYINIKIKDYLGKDHPEEIFSDSIIVSAWVGEHGIITAWKRIDTPTVPTLARILIQKGFRDVGEKEFLAETLDELKYLPYKDKNEIIDYAKRYLKHIVIRNLQENGLL